MTTTNNKTQQADSSFMRQAMAAPMLERTHEAALARAWLNNRDETALHELITAHERLAIAAAQKFRHYGIPVADLAQEGMIGLLQAAGKFEPDRDLRFSTYAMWWVRSCIQDYILRNWSLVRTGTTAAQKSLFFNLRRLRAKIDGASPNLTSHEKRTAIATTLDVSLPEVEAMEQRMNGGDQSLNTPIGDLDGNEHIHLLVDHRPNPEDIVMGLRDAHTRSAWLAQALSGLSTREQAVIRDRHLSAHTKTLEELGITLGISKERVRQIEARAMEKLRASLTPHKDDLMTMSDTLLVA
jgi:RNA polymerase sigma-32 factor